MESVQEHYPKSIKHRKGVESSSTPIVPHVSYHENITQSSLRWFLRVPGMKLMITSLLMIIMMILSRCLEYFIRRDILFWEG